MRKAQSAMEYLMTYGWSILIIAVVLGVLFQLGVFSSSSFSVKAPPGSCQVLRASGTASLVGQCSGALPQYVAQFDGASSYMNAGNPPSIRGGPPITISVWVKTNVPVTSVYDFLYHNQAAWTSGWEFNLETGGSYGQVVFEFANAASAYEAVGSTFSSSPAGQWINVVAVISATQKGMFVNGVGSMIAGGGLAPSSTTLAIGRASWGGRYFSGQIANLQIYNASLDANQIQALYVEGMGGAPILPQNVIGWWPLNGNVNDYSGNGNNGVPASVTYVTQYGK
jgi:hypothetical protein